MTEKSHEGGGQEHPHRGQQSRLHRYRLGRLPAGAEAAVEHYENKGDGADITYKPGIVVRKLIVVTSEKKPQHQEEQQYRNPEFTGNLVQKNTDDYDQSED